jgi:hypothetical protein
MHRSDMQNDSGACIHSQHLKSFAYCVASKPRFGGDSQALSWYRPAEERPSWAGTSWKGSAGQGPANRTRQALDRKGFLMSISISSFPR